MVAADLRFCSAEDKIGGSVQRVLCNHTPPMGVVFLFVVVAIGRLSRTSCTGKGRRTTGRSSSSDQKRKE
jgi:hypothetical protein